MIRVHLEWFSSGTVKKLQARGADPFKILKRVGPNAYVVDLALEYGITSTFNVVDLVAYKEPTTIPSDPFELSPPFESEPTLVSSPTQMRAWHEQIEKMLDEQITNTRN